MQPIAVTLAGATAAAFNRSHLRLLPPFSPKGRVADATHYPREKPCEAAPFFPASELRSLRRRGWIGAGALKSIRSHLPSSLSGFQKGEISAMSAPSPTQ